MTERPEPVEVQVWGTLRDALDGQERVTVRARTIRELLDGLAEEYPALAPQLETGVSVSIDGAIYNGVQADRAGPGDRAAAPHPRRLRARRPKEDT